MYLARITRFACLVCDTDLARDELVCPSCGSADRHIEVEIESASGIETSLGLQARHGQPGEIKPYMRQYSDIKWNHDRQRNERRVMVTDSERDYYLQEWFCIETGGLVWRKEGRLSDPDIHGKFARRRRREE